MRALKEHISVEGTFEEEHLQEEEEEAMAQPNECTLRDRSTSNVDQQLLCITYPTTTGNFKLKLGLIHLLPYFSGCASEDPHKHMKEFHIVCDRMRLHGVTEEQMNLRAFPFSLKDDVKDWHYFLPTGSVTTWKEMKKEFLEKFSSASEVARIRKEMYDIT